eukprot:TRINITY_DN3068_c0_g1_i2.p1 TRINITY_DN3068_c0_g1~~TRINITY_DN3068_c0_g1_i2.p1  ORF type:complete len:305 (+),score=52.59 TRINITY_DN3068_c0_g1_i2:197-1111(+)
MNPTKTKVSESMTAKNGNSKRFTYDYNGDQIPVGGSLSKNISEKILNVPRVEVRDATLRLESRNGFKKSEVLRASGVSAVNPLSKKSAPARDEPKVDQNFQPSIPSFNPSTGVSLNGGGYHYASDETAKNLQEKMMMPTQTNGAFRMTRNEYEMYRQQYGAPATVKRSYTNEIPKEVHNHKEIDLPKFGQLATIDETFKEVRLEPNNSSRGGVNTKGGISITSHGLLQELMRPSSREEPIPQKPQAQQEAPRWAANYDYLINPSKYENPSKVIGATNVPTGLKPHLKKQSLGASRRVRHDPKQA